MDKYYESPSPAGRSLAPPHYVLPKDVYDNLLDAYVGRYGECDGLRRRVADLERDNSRYGKDNFSLLCQIENLQLKNAQLSGDNKPAMAVLQSVRDALGLNRGEDVVERAEALAKLAASWTQWNASAGAYLESIDG